MPVEFALRPRIRLREEPAPARRARARLPRFALPALAYWLVIGGLVYEFVHRHEPSPSLAEPETALAQLTPAVPPAMRPWWRPLPAPVERAAVADTPTSVPVAPTIAAAEAPEAAELPEAVEVPEAVEATIPEPRLTLAPARGSIAAEPPLFRPSPSRKPSHTPASAFAADPDRKRMQEPLAVSAPLAALPLPSDPEGKPAPLPSPAPAPAHAASGLPSCEAALASASQDVDFTGGNRVADLPTQAIAAVLENGAWLSSCAVPEHTTLEVCVAIQGGRVVGATVNCRPADSALNQCLKRRASALQFPYSPHLDLARTRF